MEELRNLKQIYSLAAGRFNQYEGKDFVLPMIFKEQVTEINSNKINYNDYSAVIETRGNQNGVLNIYLPNQWFYIASYFTDFYNELQRYKKEALKVVSKERLKDLNGSSLTEQEESRLQSLSLTEQSKSYLRRFMTDYSWWFGAKTIDRGDFYVSPILNSARLVNASQTFVADLCAFLANKTDLVQAIISGEEAASKKNNSSKYFSFQQIFYGAPGTGKSFKIKNDEKVKKADEKNLVFRTTFHPDSDYSTFVGAYKPTMKSVADKYKAVVGKDEEITYEFIPQAFLQAYIAAWNNQEENVFLIIEEINRGNCAQIFGDLFQLLDRDDEGFSEYPIKADRDLAKYLSGKDEKGNDVLVNKDGIKDGKLKLPKNLFIWATMNTSDQSLFPIDSAFKRRWDWEYVPIHNCNKGWRIAADNNEFNWWSFIDKINNEIGELTSSEDKKLGYFFCKADENGIISSDKFVSKVIFYLWNEVFKDFDVDNEILNDGDSKLTFNSFYGINGEDIITRKDKVELFLNNLGVEIVQEINSQEEEKDDSGTSDEVNGIRDRSRYSINGVGNYKKSELVKKVAQMYVDNNSGMSADEVIAVWRNLGINEYHFVETQAEYDARVSASKDGNSRANPIKWGNNIMYITSQWGIGNIGTFINCINRQDWNITIEKVSE